MKLRSHQRVVTSGQEGRPPRSWPMRGTTLLYYAALLLLVGYIVYYVQYRVRYFTTPGLVATVATPVAPTREGRLREMSLSPGDPVLRGDALFVVEPGLACAPTVDGRAIDLATDIEMTRARREITAERLLAVETRMDELRGRSGLELDGTLRQERAQIERDIAQLRSERALLTAEIGVLENALAGLPPSGLARDPRCTSETVRAPFDGVVHAVLRDAFDVVAAGEPVVELQTTEPAVRVLARVDPELLPDLRVGNPVTVRFPDGTSDLGTIDTLYAATGTTNRERLEEYHLIAGDVLMEISPTEAAASARWRSRDRLYVDVTGRRGDR